MSRKPRDRNFAMMDFYFEQHAEPIDLPNVTVKILYDCYEFLGDPNNEKLEIRNLKDLHTWLGKAIKYLEHTRTQPKRGRQ